MLNGFYPSFRLYVFPEIIKTECMLSFANYFVKAMFKLDMQPYYQTPGFNFQPGPWVTAFHTND